MDALRNDVFTWSLTLSMVRMRAFGGGRVVIAITLSVQ